MDNAFEAVEKIPEAFIEVTAQKKENSPFIVIVVINSCRTAPAYDSDHLPISNKENTTKHGYGIKSIKKVTKNMEVIFKCIMMTPVPRSTPLSL